MLRIRLALLSATLALVACNDATTTSPPVITNFDARHALSKIDPLAAVLDQPIYRSFNGALSSFEVYFRTAPVGPPIAVRTRIGAFDARLTRALAPSTEIRASAIPNNVQGKTFVWNVDTRTYIADAAAAGAASAMYVRVSTFHTNVFPCTLFGIALARISVEGASARVRRASNAPIRVRTAIGGPTGAV